MDAECAALVLRTAHTGPGPALCPPPPAPATGKPPLPAQPPCPVQASWEEGLVVPGRGTMAAFRAEGLGWGLGPGPLRRRQPGVLSATRSRLPNTSLVVRGEGGGEAPGQPRPRHVIVKHRNPRRPHSSPVPSSRPLAAPARDHCRRPSRLPGHGGGLGLAGSSAHVAGPGGLGTAPETATPPACWGRHGVLRPPCA